MKMPRTGRIARIGAALLGGALGLAAGAASVEAPAPATVVDNLPVKTADIRAERLLLPSAWGEAATPALAIDGEAQEAAGADFAWNTGLVFPGTNTVTLAYGTNVFAATFEVGALALADWGAATLDNLSAPRVAADSERMAMPAAWGETPAGGTATVTVTGPLGAKETPVAGDAASWSWNSVPCIPGDYTATLAWGSDPGQTYEVAYTVAAAGGMTAEETAFVDNAFDADDSHRTDVRDIAGHTNVFALAWGAGEPSLTLDGEAVATAGDAWTWETNGLTYALYTFTNAVDGSNHVATFRVNAADVAAVYNDERIDPLVAKSWEHLPGDKEQMSRAQLSAALKAKGGNGLELWKSYMLGIDPDSAVGALRSTISVTRDAEGRTVATVSQAEPFDPPQGAIPVIRFEAADEAAGPYETVTGGSSEKATELVETVPADKTRRFYRQTLDAERPLRTSE